MDALKAALDDQSSADAREGALFAFESLCEKLGRYAKHHLVAVGLIAPVFMFTLYFMELVHWACPQMPIRSSISWVSQAV